MVGNLTKLASLKILGQYVLEKSIKQLNRVSIRVKVSFRVTIRFSAI